MQEEGHQLFTASDKASDGERREEGRKGRGGRKEREKGGEKR